MHWPYKRQRGTPGFKPLAWHLGSPRPPVARVRLYSCVAAQRDGGSPGRGRHAMLVLRLTGVGRGAAASAALKSHQATVASGARCRATCWNRNRPLRSAPLWVEAPGGGSHLRRWPTLAPPDCADLCARALANRIPEPPPRTPTLRATGLRRPCSSARSPRLSTVESLPQLHGAAVAAPTLPGVGLPRALRAEAAATRLTPFLSGHIGTSGRHRQAPGCRATPSRPSWAVSRLCGRCICPFRSAAVRDSRLLPPAWVRACRSHSDRFAPFRRRGFVSSSLFRLSAPVMGGLGARRLSINDTAQFRAIAM